MGAGPHDGVKQTTRRSRRIRGTSLERRADANPKTKKEEIAYWLQSEFLLELRAPKNSLRQRRDLTIVNPGIAIRVREPQSVELALKGGVDATHSARDDIRFSA
jgi:hypothetical protein